MKGPGKDGHSSSHLPGVIFARHDEEAPLEVARASFRLRYTEWKRERKRQGAQAESPSIPEGRTTQDPVSG